MKTALGVLDREDLESEVGAVLEFRRT